MVEIWLPYGASEVHVSIPIRDLSGVVEPAQSQPAQDPKGEIADSIRNPIGGIKLSDALTSTSTVALAVDGLIEPSLAKMVTATIIEELQSSGVTTENIMVLMANGDRERSNQNLATALGAEPMLQRIRRLDFKRGSTEVTNKGATSRRTKIEISSQYASADFRIALGEVIPDAFTGFGGAQNAVVPGLVSMGTLEAIRSQAFDDKAAPGVTEGNPVLAETFEAASLAGVDLAVNLVANSRGKLLKSFAGSMEESWRRAVAEVGDSYRIKAEANADVIVASAGGIRFDFDLYHAIMTLKNISRIAKKGAVIILLAECTEGLGADGLSRLSHIDTLSELRRRYSLGGEAVHLVKSVTKINEVFLVSALPRNLTDPLGFGMAKTANDALKAAAEAHRRRRVLAVTRGCSTLPFLEGKKGDKGQEDHGEVEKGEKLPG